MSQQNLYHFIQTIFPTLATQPLPQHGLDHFGEFFDWMNLNATYIQAFHPNQPHKHGFEDNDLFIQSGVVTNILITQLQQRIDRLRKAEFHKNNHLIQQDIFRLMIAQTYQFLKPYHLDLLLFHTSTQYFWLSFPQLAETERTQFCTLFKTTFNEELPIQLLDPKILTLFI